MGIPRAKPNRFQANSLISMVGGAGILANDEDPFAGREVLRPVNPQMEAAPVVFVSACQLIKKWQFLNQLIEWLDAANEHRREHAVRIMTLCGMFDGQGRGRS